MSLAEALPVADETVVPVAGAPSAAKRFMRGTTPSRARPPLMANKVQTIEKQTAKIRHRGITVRMTLAWLDGMTLDEAGIVVGVPAETLRRWLHGERIEPRRQERIDRSFHLVRKLRMTLEGPAVAWWFRTEDPALGGMSPLEAIRRGRIDEVAALVDSYLDPSYG